VRLTTKDTKSAKDEFTGRAGFECLRINLEQSGPDACSDDWNRASSGFSFAFPFVHFVVHFRSAFMNCLRLGTEAVYAYQGLYHQK
jgi:hypothetical protein